MRVLTWPSSFERLADGADAAVHHVAGRDDVGAGLGVRQRLPHQRGVGFVVERRSRWRRPGRPGRGVVYGSSATSVITPSSGKRCLSARIARCARPSASQAAAPSSDLASGAVTGNRVRAGMRERHGPLGHAQQFVDRQALDPGHGGDRRTPGQLVDEHRQDQVVAPQAVSRISRRENSSRRMRRGRVCGKAIGRLRVRAHDTAPFAMAPPGRRWCMDRAGGSTDW